MYLNLIYQLLVNKNVLVVISMIKKKDKILTKVIPLHPVL